MITPGNIAVTSGTAVTVTPTATTTYTLTVTPSTGTAVTATAAITVSPVPVITGFTVTPGTISPGSPANLTATFTGGTGSISPGAITVTSGTPVTVAPITTTIYTLTVTPPVGAPITQAVTVTVSTGPFITSFVANPNSITAGQSTNLTGMFSNGTGVITPGNLPAISGTPVTVSPTTTTAYTLTVTSTTGSAVSATATATVTVSAVSPSAVTVNRSPTSVPVSDQLIGMNMAVWNDTTLAAAVPGFQSIGVKAVRWPGGSTSDIYHWEGANNTPSGPTLCDGGYASPGTTFANFVNDLAVPASLDIALTANYGSNEACNGGGEPGEAAAWVANALTLGVTVSHLTVGNEVYGASWEYDLHTPAHDPGTYAAAVGNSTSNGYYQQVKTASPNTLIGVVVDAGSPSYGGVIAPDWDPNVLANSQYDFVEYHYYPQDPGSESDSSLVHSAAQGLTTGINTIKAELSTVGKPNTPIYVGEMGSVSSNPGKQSWSITQGLFAGQMLGEMMNDGVSRATWWIGFGNCNGQSGNDSASLYGWQDFGAYNVFSDGSADGSCPGAGPLGTLSPTAVAFQLFSKVAVTGEFVLATGVTGDTTDVRAYAATNSGGTALVVFNLNETVSEPITITLSGQSTATSVTQTTYDKALYDQSGPSGNPANPLGTDTWAPPTTTPLGAQALPLSVTLTPWSMNVFIIK
jgi:hypothetical protein